MTHRRRSPDVASFVKYSSTGERSSERQDKKGGNLICENQRFSASKRKKIGRTRNDADGADKKNGVKPGVITVVP
jgi:hypothetical protein